MKSSILVIEDDEETAGFLRVLLLKHGYKAAIKGGAEEGLGVIRQQLPDLVISDLHLPGLSGIKLCEILRSDPRTASLPIILLTISGSEADKIRGLKIGADDYVTKPFSANELMARVEALLRRVQNAGVPAQCLRIKDLIVDMERREVTLKGKPLTLRHKEYELLVLFLEKQGRVLTKEFLTNALWKDEVIVTSNTLNTHIKNLRQKMGPYQSLIETIIGEGYKLNDRF